MSHGLLVKCAACTTKQNNACHVVAREGVRGLYKGLANEVIEGLLGAAILLLVKEQVAAGIRKGVYAAWR